MRRPQLEPGVALARAGVALLVMAGAALGIGNIFVDMGWVVPTAVAIVAGVGMVLLWQLLRLPTFVAVGLSLLLGLAWIAAWWPLSAAVSWVDRPAALVDGLFLANQEIVTQVAPTPTLNGLLLITVAGTFLVAVAVAELLSARAVLTALLAALVLWAVPLSVPVSGRALLVPSLALLIPAAIALAVVSDPTTGTLEQPPRLRLVAAVAGVAMVLVAVPVATALPGHDGVPLVDLRGLGTTLEGSQPLVDVGDQLHLPAPRPALRVTTDTPAYLRTAALEVFDGSTWRIGTDIDQTSIPNSAMEDPTNGIRGDVAPGPISSWNVTVQALPGTWLPVVNQPTRVAAAAGPAALSWSAVGDFATVDSMTSLVEAEDLGPDYVVEAVVPRPTLGDLVAVGPATDDLALRTQLPTGQDRLVDQAAALVDQAGATSAIERVLVVQDWFAGPDSEFQYSTDVPGLRGTSALERFALETKIGYCEYYATAMAVMLRGLGIPARVATGYLPGRELSAPSATQPGLYQVSSTDAHAWVEVAFEGVGWVTFDPTPRSDTAGLRPGADALAPFGPNGGTAQAPIGAPSEDDLLRASEPPSQPLDGVPVPGTAAGGAAGDASGVPVGLVLAILAILAVLAAVVGAWWWRSRTPPTSTDPAERILLAQSHLLVTAAALGLGRRPDDTIHDVTRRWIDSGDVDGPSAQLIARRASLVAFGGRDVVVTDDEAAEFEEAVARVSQQLRDAVSRGERLRAEVRRMTMRAEDA